MTTTHLRYEDGRTFNIGDEVENADCIFFIGYINDSQGLCFLDKGKPFVLKNPQSAMAKCILQGNYGASAITLRNLSLAKLQKAQSNE